MSEMSYLEKLLDGVEVEWIKVGDLISPQRGRRLVRSQLEEAGSYAVYQNSMKPLGYHHECNAPAGTAFVIVAGAAGEVGFSDGAFWAADDVYYFPVTDDLNNKYLYHFLLTKEHEISTQVRRASIPRLSIAVVENLKIPIPPLHVQKEIVRILDTFTELTNELTTELTTELTNRKKQYNHYRDQLLSFEEGAVEWKSLPEMALDFGRGKSRHRPRNDERLYGGDVPFIQTGDIRGASHVITQYSQTYSKLGLEQSKLWSIPFAKSPFVKSEIFTCTVFLVV